MVKNHMKRITAPRSWGVDRKTAKFITKPKPGAHKLEQSMAVNTLFKELIGLTNTTKESKYLLTHDEVFVNRNRKRDFKSPVGLLDIVYVKSANKYFLISVDKKGALKPKEVSDKQAANSLLKISGKSILGKDKVQINTTNGLNLLVKESEAKKYKVGDSLIVELKSLKVVEHIPLKEKGLVFVYTGKHSSKSGVLESFNDKTAVIKQNDESFETSKDYLMAINKEKIAEFE